MNRNSVSKFTLVLALKVWTDLTLRTGLVQLCSDTAELRVWKAESRDAAQPPRILFCSLQSTQAVFTRWQQKRARMNVTWHRNASFQSKVPRRYSLCFHTVRNIMLMAAVSWTDRCAPRLSSHSLAPLYLYREFHRNCAETKGRSTKTVSPFLKLLRANRPLPWKRNNRRCIILQEEEEEEEEQISSWRENKPEHCGFSKAVMMDEEHV